MNIFDKGLLEKYIDPSADTIVMFHGYGADAHDLFPLAEYIQSSKKHNWYFPNGPLEVSVGGGWVGRAWWPISLERYQQESHKLDISEEIPKGLDKLVDEFKSWTKSKNIDPSKLILAGFSQGGMLALNLFFNLEVPPKGLVLLSSNLVNKTELKTKIKPEMSSCYYLISHGHNDPVLPLAGSDRLQSFLNQAGLKGKMLRFQGGHEIPQNVLAELGLFISQ